MDFMIGSLTSPYTPESGNIIIIFMYDHESAFDSIISENFRLECFAMSTTYVVVCILKYTGTAHRTYGHSQCTAGVRACALACALKSKSKFLGAIASIL